MQAGPEPIPVRQTEDERDQGDGQGQEGRPPAVEPDSEPREQHTHSGEQAEASRGPDPTEQQQAHQEAAHDAPGDVGGLEEAHLPPARAHVVLDGALQHREREAHQHRRHPEEEGGKAQVGGRQPPEVGVPAQPHGPGRAPGLVEVCEDRSVRGQTGDQQDGAGGPGEQQALEHEKRPERPLDPRDDHGAGQAADGATEQVERQQSPEREGGRPYRDVEEPEPEDLESQGAEAARRVEPHPEGQRPAGRGLPSIERAGRRHAIVSRALPGPQGRQERRHGRQQVGRGSRGDRPTHPHEADQQPGRRHRPEARAEDVDAVEDADRARGPPRVAHHGAGEEREGHAHQQGRKQEREEVQQPGAPGDRVEPAHAQVEQVVEEGARRGTEDRHPHLDRGESPQGPIVPQPGAPEAARVAAQAEPGHERPHDHGHRVDPDAARQLEDPLPHDLVDERSRAAEEERHRHEGKSRGRRGDRDG